MNNTAVLYMFFSNRQRAALVNGNCRWVFCKYYTASSQHWHGINKSEWKFIDMSVAIRLFKYLHLHNTNRLFPYQLINESFITPEGSNIGLYKIYLDNVFIQYQYTILAT